MAAKKATKKATKKVVGEVAEKMTAAIFANARAWREKRERAHKGLTNANIEDPNG